MQPDIHAELDKMSSHAIARVWRGLHELVDREMQRVCIDILRRRHGRTLAEWPVHEAEVGGFGPAAGRSMGTMQMVTFCYLAASPNHPDHRPVDELSFEYQVPYDQDGAPRTIYRIWCSCGEEVSGIGGKMRRTDPRASVWPIVRIDGAPFIQMCKFSPSVDDLAHCPGVHGMKCLCGSPLGEANMDGDDKILPAY